MLASASVIVDQGDTSWGPLMNPAPTIRRWNFLFINPAYPSSPSMSSSSDSDWPYMGDGETKDCLTNFIHVVFGIFFWDFLNTLRVEIGWRNAGHWVTAVYLMSRYSLLLFCVGLVLSVSARDIDRHAVLVLISCTEVSVIASATTILVLRVVAVWKERRRILCPLLVLSFVQWVLLYSTLPFKNVWIGTSTIRSDDTVCMEPVILVASLYTTLFHGALLLGVVLGNQTAGTFDGSLRGFLMGDCCYFVCVLSASITELVLSCTCVAREVHQGLRVAACMIIGLAGCRIFRRFDAHHRPEMNEQAAPIVAVTRRLTSKPSQTLIALRRGSYGGTSRPSTARNDSSTEGGEGGRDKRVSNTSNLEARVEPLEYPRQLPYPVFV